MDCSEVFAPGYGCPVWADSDVWLVQFDKLPKLELKVKICCKKCEEILGEWIKEVQGVVTVEIDRGASKVTVTGHPDSSRLLKEARKTDKKASISSDSRDKKPKPEPENDPTPPSHHSQCYPPRCHPCCPDFSQCPFANPHYPCHYLKHVKF